MNDYISKVILMPKEKFSKHCDWEETEWIIRMRGEYFYKKCKCEQVRINVDLYKDTKCGLYSKPTT